MKIDNSKWRRELIELCQRDVEEPVISVGLLQPAGSTVAAVLMFVSPLASFLRRRAGRRSAPGFPLFGLFAVTDHRLVVFDARPAGRGWKVKRVAMEFPRDTLDVSVEHAGITRRIVLTDAAGTQYRVESPGLVNRSFNDQLVFVLTGGPSTQASTAPQQSRHLG